MLPVKAPRDPAPSRVLYRLERLWLRPAIRNSVRIGMPLLAAGWLVVSLVMDPAVQQMAKDRYTAVRNQVASHPGLMIHDLEIDGVSPELHARLLVRLGLKLPISSMDLDLPALQKRVVGLDQIATAHVRVEGGGILRVSATERTAVMLWRRPDGALAEVDETGVMLGMRVSRDERPDLPVVAGHSADKAVGEALHLLSLAEPIADKVRGLVRVGERRWTLVMTSGLQIKLPETGAASALARVIALHAADELLSRDLSVVDMRDSRRPILQLSPQALHELKRARGLIEEEDV